MSKEHFHLLTPLEAEAEFGEKYFYRQRIYRLAERGKIVTFNRQGQVVYLGNHILEAFLKEVKERIQVKFPELDIEKIQVFYDTSIGKRIVVDGLFGKGVSVDTTKETEDDLFKKIGGIIEWMQTEPKKTHITEIDESDDNLTEFYAEVPGKEEDISLAQVLPEEILWIKVEDEEIEGVEVKSGILISLPSIAQFIGIRTDAFINWLSQDQFKGYILSAHYKQIQGTQITVPWKKGVITGYTPFIPFEHVPEIIVSFKHSGRNVNYPQKAELLYETAKNTLSAVGLAISGNRDKAAQELASVGKSLGLSVADQIIGIFKQYESREYQVMTNKEFASKIKAIGEDYAMVTGKLTLGITDRTAASWKLYGVSKSLPSKHRSSSREVMRQLSPEDGVGMTFGERHFIKDPNMGEAIETGRQGKDFYKRLKNVGLLDDDSTQKNLK